MTAGTDLLCTVAHPDDESFGLGSLLAGAVAAGARVVLVCATRGEAGEDHTGAGRTGDVLGEVREQELRTAAAELGVAEVEVLGFADSGWDGPAPVNALVNAGEAAVTAVHQALTDTVITPPSELPRRRPSTGMGTPGRSTTGAFCAR
ncbi:MAG TPA: PIG-L family deacetylase [Acidimicrobiales bacterium]|nr:PIG-L family deacetylase [Acidimicrobiales bacterium]